MLHGGKHLPLQEPKKEMGSDQQSWAEDTWSRGASLSVIHCRCPVFHHVPLSAETHRDIARRIQFCKRGLHGDGHQRRGGRMTFKSFLSMMKDHNLKEEDYDWLVAQLKDRFSSVEKILDMTVTRKAADECYPQ